jgi:hypothetical protein
MQSISKRGFCVTTLLLAVGFAVSSAPLSAQSSGIATSLPRETMINMIPDLTFDDAKMRQDAQGGAFSGPPAYRVHIKNIGVGRSKATRVECTDVADFIELTFGAGPGKVTRKTTTWNRSVPEIAGRQLYSDSAEVLGNEKLVSRNCVIDPQSLVYNGSRTNDRFVWSDPTASARQVPPKQPSAFVPGAKLTNQK